MGTILIVDDYPVNQRLLYHRLRGNGHDVLIASNGVEALELLNRPATPAIQLAIVDIAMPEMDGLTLLHHLRLDPRFKLLPVIMLTASGQDGDRETAEAEGANAFLTKPVSSWELAETVNRFLQESERI